MVKRMSLEGWESNEARSFGCRVRVIRTCFASRVFDPQFGDLALCVLRSEGIVLSFDRFLRVEFKLRKHQSFLALSFARLDHVTDHRSNLTYRLRISTSRTLTPKKRFVLCERAIPKKASLSEAQRQAST